MSDTQCQQLVTIDNCCDPQQCPEPAAMRHEPTGAMLCASHFDNGAKYNVDGTWVVGTTTVTMPDGWEPLDQDVVPAAPTFEAVSAVDVRPSGLVIERSVLESSGLVLGGAPAAPVERRAEIIGRAGGEDFATGDPSEG
ncbi:MAG: hypothetical protein R3C39_00955 [Dehalococcoidia bacterium]